MVSVLMARIDAGVYPIGESMPSERELMAEFGVSRVTVRNVLERLESEALIERKASRGTFVRPKRVASRARGSASRAASGRLRRKMPRQAR
jgi:DNA-binding GntR family transcriptional regulator